MFHRITQSFVATPFTLARTGRPERSSNTPMASPPRRAGRMPDADMLQTRLMAATLPHREVLSTISALSRPIIEQTRGAYDLAVVVLRGGGLMAPCLTECGHRVVGLRPGEPLPAVLAGARRILVCDTLAETGSTFERVVRHIHERHAEARVDVCAVFATDEAIERVRPLIGRAWVARPVGDDAFFARCLDIPFDFGDVAATCGLSLAGQVDVGPRFKGVIFDFDNTLVDTEGLYFAADAAVLADFGVELTRACKAAYVGMSPEVFWQQMVEEHRLPVPSDALVARSARHFRAISRTAVELMEHMVPVVTWFYERGYAMAIASGSARQTLECLLAEMGIRHCFDAVVSSAEVGRGKPAPDVFIEAANRIGLPPSEVLVFEDSAAGVVSAQRAGMACVAIPTRYADVVPDHHAADLVFDGGRTSFDFGRVLDFAFGPVVGPEGQVGHG